MPLSSLRVGHGYDLHRLEPKPPEGRGRPLVLAGVAVEHSWGPVSHSDGDAVLHAVYDAIAGALGEPDIGQAFPDSDPRHEGADSRQFIDSAVELLRRRRFAIVNIDVTVVCERPKLAPHKRRMVETLASLLGTESSRVNLKGKTHEKVDAVGEGRAVEVHAVVLLASTA